MSAAKTFTFILPFFPNLIGFSTNLNDNQANNIEISIAPTRISTEGESDSTI